MFCPNRTLLLFLSAALLLNGCILERIFKVKSQLCDFEKNFQIEISEGFRVILHNPVMLDEDIIWLTGAEPSERTYIGNELVMRYIAQKRGASANGQYDIPVELRFVLVDGEYRLKAGFLSKNLTEILTEELLSQIIRSVCKSEKSLVKQQISVDIGALERSLLPSKTDITAVLGPPNRDTGNNRKLAYDYRLKYNDSIDNVAEMEILFDMSGERIIRLKLKYLRYNLDADFKEGHAILTVDIISDEKI